MNCAFRPKEALLPLIGREQAIERLNKDHG